VERRVEGGRKGKMTEKKELTTKNLFYPLHEKKKVFANHQKSEGGGERVRKKENSVSKKGGGTLQTCTPNFLEAEKPS